MKIEEIISILREKLWEYRLSRKGLDITNHVNAIDIAISLTEFGLEDGREISKDEKNWFRADYHLSFAFSGTEWEDLFRLYGQLVEEVEKRDYFKK